MTLWTTVRLAVLYAFLRLLEVRPHFHVHVFRPRPRWWNEVGHCRCGMAKRRMMGGYGYAHVGGLWLDRPEAADRERAELADR